MPRKTTNDNVDAPAATTATESAPETTIAPIIPAYKADDKASHIAHYEGRTKAVHTVLKGEKIAKSDYAQIMGAGLITKPGFENSVYELTPKGVKELSSQFRQEVMAQNATNKGHNDAEYKKQLPAIVGYLIQNKEVVVNILDKGIAAFRNQTPEQKELVKPIHVALDRVTLGDRDHIAGLSREVWSELNKPAYKDNPAAQEITKAAEKALDRFNDLRDRYDQYVRLKESLDLANDVLERKRPVRQLSDAQQKLLQVKVEGTVHNLISKTAPVLTEAGRDFINRIRETSPNLKAEATLILDASAKNSRDLARSAEKKTKTQTQAAPSI